MNIETKMKEFLYDLAGNFIGCTLDTYKKDSNDNYVYKANRYGFNYQICDSYAVLVIEELNRPFFRITPMVETKNNITNPYRFRVMLESYKKFFDSFTTKHSIREDYDFFATRIYEAVEVVCVRHNFKIDRHYSTSNLSFDLYCNCIDKDTFERDVYKIVSIIKEIIAEVNDITHKEYTKKVEIRKQTLDSFKEQAESDSAKVVKMKAVVYSCFRNNDKELVIMKGGKTLATISNCPNDVKVMYALANDILYDLGYIKEDYF